MRRLYLVIVAGCAEAGGPAQEHDAAIDASMLDAPPDAPPPCNEVMTELLKNPAFDSTPMGTMWMQTPINPTYPLITDQGNGTTTGINEQSAPFDAWLGGLQGTDVLWQDVSIPPRTRLINLSGFYEVRTGETGAAAVDTGTIAWTTTADAPIATIVALDNTKKTTTWTTLNYGLSNAEQYSGMTLRLKLTTTNPNTTYTSFYFDTFSVKATHCMP